MCKQNVASGYRVQVSKWALHSRKDSQQAAEFVKRHKFRTAVNTYAEITAALVVFVQIGECTTTRAT